MARQNAPVGRKLGTLLPTGSVDDRHPPDVALNRVMPAKWRGPGDV